MEKIDEKYPDTQEEFAEYHRRVTQDVYEQGTIKHLWLIIEQQHELIQHLRELSDEYFNEIYELANKLQQNELEQEERNEAHRGK
jgi:hypothetical protein